jgi:hypothetical protein
MACNDLIEKIGMAIDAAGSWGRGPATVNRMTYQLPRHMFWAPVLMAARIRE